MQQPGMQKHDGRRSKESPPIPPPNFLPQSGRNIRKTSVPLTLASSVYSVSSVVQLSPETTIARDLFPNSSFSFRIAKETR